VGASVHESAEREVLANGLGVRDSHPEYSAGVENKDVVELGEVLQEILENARCFGPVGVMKTSTQTGPAGRLVYDSRCIGDVFLHGPSGKSGGRLVGRLGVLLETRTTRSDCQNSDRTEGGGHEEPDGERQLSGDAPRFHAAALLRSTSNASPGRIEESEPIGVRKRHDGDDDRCVPWARA
jgi:hypothetical protein